MEGIRQRAKQQFLDSPRYSQGIGVNTLPTVSNYQDGEQGVTGTAISLLMKGTLGFPAWAAIWKCWEEVNDNL